MRNNEKGKTDKKYYAISFDVCVCVSIDNIWEVLCCHPFKMYPIMFSSVHFYTRNFLCVSCVYEVCAIYVLVQWSDTLQIQIPEHMFLVSCVPRARISHDDDDARWISTLSRIDITQHFFVKVVRFSWFIYRELVPNTKIKHETE